MGEAHKLTEARASVLGHLPDEGAGKTYSQFPVNTGVAMAALGWLRKNGFAHKRAVLGSVLWWRTDAGRAALARHRGETP